MQIQFFWSILFTLNQDQDSANVYYFWPINICKNEHFRLCLDYTLDTSSKPMKLYMKSVSKSGNQCQWKCKVFFSSDLCHRRRCSQSFQWVSSCVLCACEVGPDFQAYVVGSCAHLCVLPETAFYHTDRILPHRSLCYLQKTGSRCTNDLQILNKWPFGCFHVAFRVSVRFRVSWVLGYVWVWDWERRNCQLMHISLMLV